MWGVGPGVPGSGLQMSGMWYARGMHAVSTGCGALCGTERGTRTRNAAHEHTDVWVRAHLIAKTPMPLPKLGLSSTSSFNRSWSLPVAATVAFHIASVALERSAVTVAVPGGSRIASRSSEQGLSSQVVTSQSLPHCEPL